VRIAIVSDIHANLAAFESVLAHARAIGYDRMVCLGDVVGYGPDPVECIDLVREHCEWTLLGNHDFAAVYEPTNFNPGAAKAVFWTRAQTLEGEWLRRHIEALQKARDEDRISDTEFLDKKCAAEVEQRERVDFMFRISPRKILLDRYICVHASPSRPVNEYLFPTDVENNTKRLERNFGLLTLPGAEGERAASAIVGHTHCPGFILEAPPDPVEVARVEAELAAQAAREQEGGAFRGPLLESAISRIPRNYEFEGFAVGVDTWTPNDDEMPAGCRFILNPGSVGQPRDGDPRACFVMLEVGENGARDRFTFHRVAYDIARTQSKLRAFAAEGAPLVEWLWERLERGQ
jgi:predicted phosphodiesterase